jgi:RNA polymerase sigma-70 factor (ECF subfamily)
MPEPTFSAVACTWDADEDRVLVTRYRQGEAQAFTELVVRYQRPVYNAAFWILRRAEDASDIAQTVFLKAAERIDDYDPRYKFFSWIYRIAVNESLNLQRQRGREEALDDDIDLPASETAGPEGLASAAQRARRLRDALMKLSASDRAVITMRHFQDCSHQEMAQVLGIEEKTVKSRLFDARQRLRGLLGDLEGHGHGVH